MQRSIADFKGEEKEVKGEATPERIVRLRDKKTGKFLGFINDEVELV